MITEIDAKLLEKIADLTGKPAGAFNIRKDMGCEARQSTEHIAIDPRADGKPGIDIHFKAGTGTRLYSWCNCRICDSCKTCEESAYYIYHNMIEFNVDSRKSCCFFIGTDRDRITTEFCMLQNIFH